MKYEDIFRTIKLESASRVGELRIEQDKMDGWIAISYRLPAFYAMQYGFREWLRLLFDVLLGREHLLFDIQIENNETLEEFKRAVSELQEVIED